MDDILDSIAPPANNPTVDKPIPTVAEETQPEPTTHLTPATNLPTLHVLFAEPPTHVFIVFFQKANPFEPEIPVFLPEEPPDEPKITPTPFPKNLSHSTSQENACTRDFKMPPVDPNAARQLRILPGRHMLILQSHPLS